MSEADPYNQGSPSGHVAPAQPIDGVEEVAKRRETPVLPSIYDIRRRNLRDVLEQEFGGVQIQLATLVEWHAANLSRFLAPPDAERHRNIGDISARQFEQKLGKPRFWMDQNHELIANTRAEMILLLQRIPLTATYLDNQLHTDMQDLGLFVYAPRTAPHAHAMRITNDHFGRWAAYVCLDGQRRPERGDRVFIQLSNGEAHFADFDTGSDVSVVVRLLATGLRTRLLRSDVRSLETVTAALPASALDAAENKSTHSNDGPAHEGGGSSA
jgi:hypothetical protein